MQHIPFADAKDAEDRSREMWEAYLGRPKNPDDVTERLYPVRVRTGDPDADAGLPDGVDVALVVPQRDKYLDKLLREDQMTGDEVAALVNLYPAWENGKNYAIGDLVAHGDELYKVAQAHKAQADWTPDKVPALFVNTAPKGVIPAWVQPTGAQDAYPLGAQVTHNGVVWESTVAANVWEPGVYGWVQSA